MAKLSVSGESRAYIDTTDLGGREKSERGCGRVRWRTAGAVGVFDVG